MVRGKNQQVRYANITRPNSCSVDAGEAQKIDRIMEKFAERYCRDNEGTFSSADGPYLLAFALIMLNTDAHNPRADKKLSCEDFVTMCQAQVREYMKCAINLHLAEMQ